MKLQYLIFFKTN